jgi:GxxExxY protein
MPISIPINLRRLDQDEFRQLDYAVMAHAFASQNELGRLCDEGIYQRDLSLRLEDAGLGPTRIEFPIQVSHREFDKVYSADLVVADAAIYELKAVSTLTGDHKRQLLNYLILCEQPRGKLVNFRSPGVESEFVNTTLNWDERHRLWEVDALWQPITDRCMVFRTILSDLLRDWGGFLETSLYADAMTNLLGGEPVVITRIPFKRSGRFLGSQPLRLLSPDVAFRITSLTDTQDQYEVHLKRLLTHTELRGIQWVNFNHHKIELKTLLK